MKRRPANKLPDGRKQDASSPMVGVVDYGMGNLGSVGKAFGHLGCDVVILTTPEAVERTRILVLPGVGAFPDAMIVPLHTEGWAHFRQNSEDLRKTFDALGFGTRLRLLEPGVPTVVQAP